MQRERGAAMKAAAIGADALIVAGLFVGVLGLRVATGPALGLPPMRFAPHLSLLWLVVPVWLVALGWQRAWTGLRRLPDEAMLGRVIRASVAAFVAVVVLLYGLHLSDEVSRTLLFGFAVATVPALWASRRGMAALARRWLAGIPASRVLLVGPHAATAPVVATLAAHPEWGWVVADRVEGAELDRLPEAIDQVVVAGTHDLDVLRRLAAACERQGVRLSLDANFLGLRTARADLEDLDGWAMLTFSSAPAHAEALLVKRVLDVVLAAAGLVLAGPLLAIAALAIKAGDGGPIVFAQERVGRYGRRFTLYKLRSMVPDAHARLPDLLARNEVNGPAFKLRDDPRVTRIGAVLRRWSIDEAPQLWNVLKGDMSLVGPRPPLADEVARYEPWQLRRLAMRPGMTCTWQVSGRSDVDFDRWMELDLAYIDGWTLGEDVRLLARTVPAVILGVGAR